MFISPMLLHKAQDNLPFDSQDWITELKSDGIRLILTRFNGVTKLYTRHKTEVTAKFREIANLPLLDNIALDGELIVSDSEGKPNFEWMMERFKSNHSKHEVTFVVFDILYYQGKKITHLPLLDRKILLEKVIPEDTDLLTKVKWMIGNAPAYFDLIKQHNLEGIVQKRADSKYTINKRSQDWLKVINYSFADVYISGYRKEEFGLLLQSGDGSYLGMMEFAPKKDRIKFHRIKHDHFLKENEKFVFLKPELKVQVKYRNLTSKGYLRIPSFVKWIN